MKLGQRVREIREGKKISQRQLAMKTGIAAATMSRLESGKFQSLNAESLRKVAEALEVTVDYLVGKTAEMSPGDHLVSDQKALSIFRDFDQIGASEKDLLLTFAEFLRQKRNCAIQVDARPWDARMDLEHVLWKIESVNRSVNKSRAGSRVRYECRLKLMRVASTTHLEFKKKLADLHVVTSVAPTKIIRGAEGSGSDERPVGINIDESEILKTAIEKAKEDAMRKLSS